MKTVSNAIYNTYAIIEELRKCAEHDAIPVSRYHAKLGVDKVKTANSKPINTYHANSIVLYFPELHRVMRITVSYEGQHLTATLSSVAGNRLNKELVMYPITKRMESFTVSDKAHEQLSIDDARSIAYNILRKCLLFTPREFTKEAASVKLCEVVYMSEKA